jgi:hypothetical protein
MAESGKGVCLACGGTGKCSWCDGKGTVVRQQMTPITTISGPVRGKTQTARTCTKCYGSGTCQACKGSKKKRE